MLLANEKQREIGIKHLSRIKEMLPFRKNAAQEAFDESPPHMSKTILLPCWIKIPPCGNEVFGTNLRRT